jgi:hypothetical protein
MQVFTYSEARQRFSEVLDLAEASGKVLIRRRDGRNFAVTPERAKASPLDVPSVDARITTAELIGIIRESRERD